MAANPAVWGASNGSTASNWTTNGTGTATPLVPGAAANVFFSDASAAAGNQVGMTLGSNMAVNSITVDGTVGTPNNTNPVTLLNTGGYVLTIGSTTSPGITVNAGSGAVALNPFIVVGNAQTWTNNSSNTLSVGSSATSVVNGTNLLTIAGSGATTITNFNGGTGGLTVNSGTGAVTLSGTTSLAGALALTNNSSNVLSVGAVNETNSSEVANVLTILGSGNTNITGIITAISTNGALAGGLTLGTAGTAAAYTGTTTVSAAATYTGNTIINSGALTFSASQNLAGGLILGSAVTNLAASTVNLSGANATFTSLAVNSNAAAANTFNITPGNSLNIVNAGSGAAGTVVQIGFSGTPAANNTVTTVTMTGGGSFNVTSLGSTFQIGGDNVGTSNGNSENATIDLTGLASTTINLGVGGALTVANPGQNATGMQAAFKLPTPLTGITPRLR